MKDKNTNVATSMEDEPFQQFEISLDQVSSLDERLEETIGKSPDTPTRTQGHMRRLSVGGLCGTDPHRSAKTEYVMRLLVSGRAPLEEPSAPAAPEPPQPERPTAPQPECPAAPEPPQPERPTAPEPERPAAPEPERPGEPKARSEVMTLENLTFDDLLAELENL